jgi:predicted metal-dependent hydrolase
MRMHLQHSIGLADQITLSNGAALWLRRSSRARRIRLTVIGAGRAELVLPKRTSLRAAIQFAEQQRSWVAKHIARHVDQSQIANAAPELDCHGRPTWIPLRGTPTRVVWADDVDPVAGDTIFLPEAATDHALTGYLKSAARADAQQAIAALSPARGRRPKSLTVRDQKTLWGSLSGKDRLSLNWRLVMAPSHVLHYVVAHEMAHLIHRNHSARFWAQTAALDPNFEAGRQWLRDHGNQLRLVLPA